MKQLYRFVRSHALGSRAPLRAFANILLWQLRARISRTAVRCRWIDGSVLMVRRGMTGATGNLYVGLHEFCDMGFVLHFLRAGDLFVDVGANVGSYTVLASRLCGAYSIAFEPDPGTCQNLADNIRANNIQPLVSAHESAVGADIGQISFSMYKDTVNHIVEAGDRSEYVRSVTITTLDAALAGQHPVLIKIDVEGHEPAVVHGAQEVLADQSLKALILEGFDEATFALLSRHGFEQYAYDPFTRTLVAGEPHKWDGNNLFLRDVAFVAKRVSTAQSRTIFGQTF